MTPLIDGDILLHEVGHASQPYDPDYNEFTPLHSDTMISILDERIDEYIIDNIKEVGEIDEPIIFLSSSEYLKGEDHIPNFRYDVAKTKPYKAGRKDEKPFHFYNIIEYLKATRNVVVSEGGLEADDEMGIVQASDPHSYIICSRDKDLRQIPGWHYSWECGKQPSLGPYYTKDFGRLIMQKSMRWSEKDQHEVEVKKVVGYGFLFLMYQLLVGDAVDNIPGLKGCGQGKAFPLLEKARGFEEAYNIVVREYSKKYRTWYDLNEYLTEQGELLYIKQRRGETFMQYIKRMIRHDMDG